MVVEPAEPQSTLGVLLAAYGLTARELDVARQVLRGDSTKAIANALHISAHTVQDHLKSVFDKVGVRSRRNLVGRLLAGQPGSSPHHPPTYQMPPVDARVLGPWSSVLGPRRKNAPWPTAGKARHTRSEGGRPLPAVPGTDAIVTRTKLRPVTSPECG